MEELQAAAPKHEDRGSGEAACEFAFHSIKLLRVPGRPEAGCCGVTVSGSVSVTVPAGRVRGWPCAGDVGVESVAADWELSPFDHLSSPRSGLSASAPGTTASWPGTAGDVRSAVKQPARAGMAGTGGEGRRHLLGTDRHGIRAPQAEPAARWRSDRARRSAAAAQRDRRGPLRVGGRAQQQLGIGVGGGIGDLNGRTRLHHLSRVHHDDPVRQVPGRGDVVGDVQDRQLLPVPQVGRAGSARRAGSTRPASRPARRPAVPSAAPPAPGRSPPAAAGRRTARADTCA